MAFMGALTSALQALHLATWPYPGVIGLEETSDDMQQIHVVRNWFCLGSADARAEARKLGKVAASMPMATRFCADRF